MMMCSKAQPGMGEVVSCSQTAFFHFYQWCGQKKPHAPQIKTEKAVWLCKAMGEGKPRREVYRKNETDFVFFS